MTAKLDELRARVEAHKSALRRHSQWIPHRPWPKQLEFSELTELEAMYGGAAGGGKTDALLADQLKWVDEPDFSGLLLRRTIPDLKLPGALIDRSHEWLRGTGARWQAQDRRYVFNTGASLQYGYCQDESDLARYKSAEFHRIGIDELTEWPERWYTFLFSRIRRRRGSRVPLGMRSATNPDGPGYSWVRERFGIPENVVITSPIRSFPNRVFFPARAEDNPALDLEAYELALEQMLGGRKGVKWRQLREGIWIPDGAGLVYAWDAKRNGRAPIQWQLERRRWTFVLGVDYGYTNACGFVVIGWRDDDPHTYILEAFTEAELEPSAAAERVQLLNSIYEFDRIVGDQGGLGKGYIEEARKRWSIPIEPAQKQNKRGYIKLFNDALVSARIMVCVDTCGDLVTEWKVLPWDKNREKELAGFANHSSDGALYAWREAMSYQETEKESGPPVGSPAALEAEAKRMEEALDDELEAEQVRARTVRGRVTRLR